jgi:hypothetical protein
MRLEQGRDRLGRDEGASPQALSGDQITFPPLSPYLPRDSRFFGEILALRHGSQDKPP